MPFIIGAVGVICFSWAWHKLDTLFENTNIFENGRKN